MIYVGIDWSSQFNDICIVNENEQKVKEFRIKINQNGFQYLLEQLSLCVKDQNDIVIGIETDKNILADFLISHGYIVYSLNPLKVNRFKDRYSVCAKKDDKFDAFSIALFLLKDRHNFNPVLPSSPECEELRLYCETLDQLTRERTRYTNRLRSDLNAYFPAFCGYFKDMTSNITLKVLKICSSPSEFKSLSKEQYFEKLGSIKYLHQKRKVKSYEFLKSEIIYFDSPREKSLANRVIILADQIIEINRLIEQTKEKMNNVNESHELATVFASLPGAGKILAPKMLALFGDNKDRFETYQSVQCYAGTSPVTAQSGKSFYSVKMRRACNKTFRDVLYKFSFCTISQEGWSAQYYKQLKDKGHSHSRAIRALSNKWVKIIFRMWKDGKNYDSNIFVTKRDKYKAA